MRLETASQADCRPVLPSAGRLHTAQRAIKQTQVTVQKIGKEIEEKLRTTAACTERVRRQFDAYELI